MQRCFSNLCLSYARCPMPNNLLVSSGTVVHKQTIFFSFCPPLLLPHWGCLSALVLLPSVTDSPFLAVSQLCREALPRVSPQLYSFWYNGWAWNNAFLNPFLQHLSREALGKHLLVLALEKQAAFTRDDCKGNIYKKEFFYIEFSWSFLVLVPFRSWPSASNLGLPLLSLAL